MLSLAGSVVLFVQPLVHFTVRDGWHSPNLETVKEIRELIVSMVLSHLDVKCPVYITQMARS